MDPKMSNDSFLIAFKIFKRILIEKLDQIESNLDQSLSNESENKLSKSITDEYCETNMKWFLEPNCSLENLKVLEKSQITVKIYIKKTFKYSKINFQ